MSRSDQQPANFSTPTRQLRFRSDVAFHNRIDEVFDEDHNKRSSSTSAGLTAGGGSAASANAGSKQQEEGRRESPSFMDFFKVELTRGYMLEHDEERYSARRQKIYSFMRIPRDLERFIVYGIMQCADSFLYIHTFLPVRILSAALGLFTRPIASCFGLRRRSLRLLTPAEKCDLLKGFIWISSVLVMLSVDTNRVYHIIKSQSIIKLYIFYNMLEVGDRLLSAFGQDTIDALFWTATEPKNSKRQHFGLLAHIVFALTYVLLHCSLIMLQATTLNVAMNSNNKALLTIMMSNNFVELKGSVFKKFDKNNLFQLTCSDVRERFHLSVLLFIVMIQTMKEFDWSLTQFCIMVPDFFAVLITEMLIDWIKHAFITRFNELPEGIYREYTTSLAYDMTQTRQKHAFSDHSDLVARRMGFIPFPLSVVLIKAIYSAVSFDSAAAWLLCGLAYLFILGLRICLTICALGKACKLMKEHQDERSSSTPSSMTNVPPLGGGLTVPSGAATVGGGGSTQSPHGGANLSPLMPGITVLPAASHNNSSASAGSNSGTGRLLLDAATSPTSSAPLLQRSITLNLSTPHNKNLFAPLSASASLASSTSTPKAKPTISMSTQHEIELDVTNSLELGATALFSNSDVDLDDVCLNEHVLEPVGGAGVGGGSAFGEELARSEPDLSLQQHKQHHQALSTPSGSGGGAVGGGGSAPASESRPASQHLHPSASSGKAEQTKRTHKRSESEPTMQSIVGAAASGVGGGHVTLNNDIGESQA